MLTVDPDDNAGTVREVKAMWGKDSKFKSRIAALGRGSNMVKEKKRSNSQNVSQRSTSILGGKSAQK